MATLTAVDTSKLCKVTNNCGSDFVVAMPLTTAETDNSNPIFSYDKNFEILVTASGATVIKNGSSDTVTLYRTYTDPKTNQPVYSLGYDLLISSSVWVRPMANISVMQDFDPDEFDPQTVTTDDLTGMQQTSDFYQTIAAYPNSQLAQDYVNAMTATDNDANNKADGSAGSGNAVDDAISSGAAAFFQNTKGYQKVSLDKICVLEYYYNNFPFVWAQYQDSATYYLYSSDGSTTTFAGTLSLQKSGPIDITKVNGGYTCTFNPAVNPTDTSKIDVDPTRAKTLTYSDGVFVDDTTSDLPPIALKGVFGLKRTFTKNPADTVIIVVISGTISGITSIGFDSSQATTPDDTTQDWLNSLFHPTTAAGIFNSVMTILGALMMLHFVVTGISGIAKWIKTQISGPTPKPVTQQDLQSQRNSINEEIKARLDAIYEKVSNNKSQLPDNSVDAQAKATSETANLSDQVSKGQIETNLGKMNENLKTLEPFAAEDATLQQRLESSATDVRNAHNTIENATTPEELNTAVTEVRPQMSQMTQDITSLNTDVSTMATQEQKAEIQQNQETLNDVQDEVNDESKVAEDEEADGTNTDPEADGIDFPPD